jgi:GxxExxY protein
VVFYNHRGKLLDEINELSGKIIGCTIEVHKQLGPGLLESVYSEALCAELKDSGIEFMKECSFPVLYKGKPLNSKLRADLIVEDLIIVELKCVEKILDIHRAQLLTYLKLLDKKLGLLLNFNEVLMKNGIHRVIL